MGAAIIYNPPIQENEIWYSHSLPGLRELPGVGSYDFPDIRTEALPFSVNDATAGAENEFQAVVMGAKTDVYFPVFIENSNYYKNLLKRAEAGETTRKPLETLHHLTALSVYADIKRLEGDVKV